MEEIKEAKPEVIRKIIIPKNKLHVNVQIVASIATIISLFFIVVIFDVNQCNEIKKDRRENINQLNALSTELLTNFGISTYLLQNAESYYEGPDSPFFRYNVDIINRLISQGVITDEFLLQQLYLISSEENTGNRMLDNINMQYSFNSIAENRTQIAINIRNNAMLSVLKGAKELNPVIHKTRELISEQINKSPTRCHSFFY